jgi:ribonuclease HII
VSLRSFDAKYERPVLGIDEVGTGCIAGPVFVAGCVLPDDDAVLLQLEKSGVRDSKQHTEATRERVFELIFKSGAVWVTMEIHPRQVEKYGPFAVVTKACDRIIGVFKRVMGCKTVLIDGIERKGLNFRHVAVKKGDQQSLTIAAASIVAKVKRDRMMVKLAEHYPGYGWINNKGYGTKEHLGALKKIGPCDVHRHSTKPVIDALELHPQAALGTEPLSQYPFQAEESEDFPDRA